MIPTHFSQLIGNDPIKKYLQRMVEKGAIANSLLFAGPDGIGKSLFAQVLAAMLLAQNDSKGHHKLKIESGSHPDILHYRPEGKLGVHSMNMLRQLNDEAHMPPYEAPWKVMIIHEADRMLTYSTNALLKVFEEPPKFVVMILLSSNPSAILPTVLSRCRTLHFHPIPSLEIEKFIQIKLSLEPQKASAVAALAQGSLARAIQMVQQESYAYRGLILDMLSQGRFPTYKALTEKIGALVDHIEAIKKAAEDAAKESLYQVNSENFSAQQVHAIEKEIEGIVSVSQVQESNTVFEIILSWYRDLHLLLVGGDRRYLINPDYWTRLEHALQGGSFLSLESIQKAIDEGRQALQRSMSLQVCLESLFLKLNLI